MKIGVQIYSLRSLIHNANDLESIFRFLHLNGAEAVEMVDFDFVDVKLLDRLSREYSIEIGSTHSNYKRLTEDTDRLIQEHLQYGCHNVGLGSMPISEFNVLRKDSILKFCDKLKYAANIAAKYNVNIDYHNHAFEFKMIGGERILDIILNNTPSHVKLCFDMYWAKVGGSSVEEYLVNHADRINVVHFKDYKKRLIGSKYTTVGEGSLDIKGIYKLAESKGVSFGYIEHDSPKDPKEVISNGLKYLLNIK